MAIITAGDSSLYIYKIALTAIADGPIIAHDSGRIVFDNGTAIDTVTGSFIFNANGLPVGGVITGLHQVRGGVDAYTFTGLNVSVASFNTWHQNGDEDSARGAVYAAASSIQGSDFADWLSGYHGNDTVQGGAGNDTIFEISGSNYLRGGDGNDSVQGGIGFDDINGNKGDDTLVGGQGSDWVVGGQGNDLLYGDDIGLVETRNRNIIYGNLGNDTCIGSSSYDLIRGGQGNDSIVSGGGGDWISGDRGDDTIFGGGGDDTFHFFSGAGVDRILNYSISRLDKIQLDAGSVYTVQQVGNDTVIDLGNGDQMTLVGINTAAFLKSDAIFIL